MLQCEAHVAIKLITLDAVLCCFLLLTLYTHTLCACFACLCTRTCSECVCEILGEGVEDRVVVEELRECSVVCV